MSSDESDISRPSSPGNWDFTEDLTRYMNGSREPPFPAIQERELNLVAPSTAATDASTATSATAEPNVAPRTPEDRTKAQIESTADDENDPQALRDELQAALEKLNEANADNERLKSELKENTATLNEANVENERLQSDLEESTAKALRVGPLERELRGSEDKEKEARREWEDAMSQLETKTRQLDIEALRIKDLEGAAEKERAAAKEAKEGEARKAEEVRALQQDVERMGEEIERLRENEDERDALSNQSLMDELEDELERTKQELERVVKDRDRKERAWENTKSDYEAERQRVEELQELVENSRRAGKEWATRGKEADEEHGPGADVQFGMTSAKKDTSMESTTPSGSSPSNEELGALRTAMEQAQLRLDGLELQLADARSAIKTQSEDFAAGTKRAEQRAQKLATEEAEARAELQAQLESQFIQRAEKASSINANTAMDRAEAVIRKLKAKESELKQDVLEATIERDELRSQQANTEDALVKSQHNASSLSKQVKELEDIKARMGRVLMYQWGKEEVGEIERLRADGKKERGMGYKYKYFNKDGTPKEA